MPSTPWPWSENERDDNERSGRNGRRGGNERKRDDQIDQRYGEGAGGLGVAALDDRPPHRGKCRRARQDFAMFPHMEPLQQVGAVDGA